jgi:hypothetical protein
MPEERGATAADQLLAFTCCCPELEEPALLPQPTSEGGQPPAWPLVLLPLGLYALWRIAKPKGGLRGGRAGDASRVAARSLTRLHRNNGRDGVRERRAVSAGVMRELPSVRRDNDAVSSLPVNYRSVHPRRYNFNTCSAPREQDFSSYFFSSLRASVRRYPAGSLAIVLTHPVRCFTASNRHCAVSTRSAFTVASMSLKCELAHTAVAQLRVTLTVGNKLNGTRSNEKVAGNNRITLAVEYRPCS